ncbi:MAG: TonB-dependent receptor [Candidatus Pedobacter colombiensis]|uniref:TonB-dependent receptor n=1 Tax=Candidatus Pedobacter colombiensis TaxID=3121371 RepID=A0AAJ6B9M7_9SPHI|nr:TonB-dependent receptor [Pedobacter sp.]WEK21631.1 MAG: TonB-dependent receptor [Pedobacter sp.]
MYKIYTKMMCWLNRHIFRVLQFLLNAAIYALKDIDKGKLIMRINLITILMIATILQVNASGFAQNVTFTGKNVSLEQVFKEVRKQTGYNILLSVKKVSVDKRINVAFDQSSVNEVMNKCLDGLPLTYAIDNKTIVVKEKEKTLIGVIKDYLSAEIIKGRVLGESGQPLPGASISVKGASGSTRSLEDGSFSISIPEKGAVLVISYIGYKSREIKIGDQNNITVRLEPVSSDLDQVVVVGYGSSRKKDLTGSVAIVSAKDVQDLPFATVDNALAGKAAGVQVTKADGTPGGAVKIRVRGSTSLLGGNDPLYVIDGVPVQVRSNFINTGFDLGTPVANNTNNAGGVSAGLSSSFVNGLNSIGGLNINDIESISILKDASSTAIYGSKAANGVVIITTKSGKKDMKPQIVANYYSTTSRAITPNVLNVDQYKMLISEAAKNDFDEHTKAADYMPAETEAIVKNPSAFFGRANTNWIDEVTRNTISHNADLSVQGGGAASKYFSSISFNSTPGVIKNTDYQRVTGKLNLENEIGKRFRFVTNLLLGYTNQHIGDGAYGQALRARPDFAPYDEKGIPTNFSTVGYSYMGFQNPVALLQATNNAKTFSLMGSASGLYDITKDLKFKSTVSLNMQTYNQRNYIPSFLSVGSVQGNVTNNGGIGSNSNSRLANWFLENTLTYNKTFNDIHELTVLAGTSYETIKNSFFSATATGYPDDKVLNNLSSATTPLITRGDDPGKPQSYLLSFYLRSNYSLLDKYLFTFTGRADGSSKFGPNNKFGYFPSGAVAWRVSQENFLKDVKWIDDIKLRGSYGLTGTQNIGDQMYRTLYSPYAYAGSNALIPTQLGNAAIKWESTKEADAGIDISLFDNRLQATVDYYNKKTNGVLLSLPIASSSSFSSLLRNTADIKNTGLEVSLAGDIIRSKNFRWNGSLNVTWNKSLVTKLDATANLKQIGSLTGLELGNSTTLIEGKPLGLITGYKVTGIIKTQEQLDAYKKELGFIGMIFYPYTNIGDLMYELDYEQYKQYQSAFPKTNEIIAQAAPKYYGGFSQGFGYKNFDLQFYFTFSQGGSLVWGDHIGSMQFSGSSNANAVMLNRYHAGNTETNQPRLLYGDGVAPISNMNVFSSSYIKLRTVSLNYKLGKSKWMERAGLLNASLFASATNLFTITKYPGNDPETTNDTYSVSGGYFDVSNYPTVRSFSLGFKLGF